MIDWDLSSRLFDADRSTAMNVINPINTLVTGEVLVERPEHLSSEWEEIEGSRGEARL